MQTLLNITLQDDNTLLVQSDVFFLETKDPDSLMGRIRRPISADEYQSIHPALKDKLILWRRAKAKEKGVSAFLILTNRTLFAISDQAPLTEEELLAVPGFGPNRFASYGMEILSLVEKSLAEEME